MKSGSLIFSFYQTRNGCNVSRSLGFRGLNGSRRGIKAFRDPATQRIWIEQYLEKKQEEVKEPTKGDEMKKETVDDTHFYYDARTWETIPTLPSNVVDIDLTKEEEQELRNKSTITDADGKRKDIWGYKPDFATDWSDPAFPEWVQYTELGSKRPYYFNRSTNITQWAPPSQPNRDIFREEVDQLKRPLKKVPQQIVLTGAPITKRVASVLIDFGSCAAGGFVFGGLVYLELGNLAASIPSIGLSTWVMFIIKDAIFERGTRSIGKRYMKLEIVKKDGQLPTRWNTAFRNLTVPVYLGSTLLFPYIIPYALLDFGLFIFTPGYRRLGDFIGGTVVIPEQPDRKERMEEKKTREELDDAKE